MAAGWATNDVQTQERRNREWLARYILGLPFPDVDDAMVPQVLPRALAFAAPTTEANVATFPPAAIVIVHLITFTNTGDNTIHAWVALFTSTFSYTDLVARALTVQPREMITFEGPWFCAGSTNVRSAANLAGVSVRLDYTILNVATPGITPVFSRNALSATLTAFYTTPGDVRSAYVASLGQVGLGSTDWTVTVTIELLPSGQASGPQFYLFNAPVPPAETEIVGGFTPQPADASRAWRGGPNERH